jgi:hypothetical protein
MAFDDLYVRVAEDSQKGFAAAIQARASFLHGFHHPLSTTATD